MSHERSPARMSFLDGLRGLSALYVVLHHAAGQVAPPTSGVLALVYRVLAHGHYAVAVFIVLSGYCLMLPVARDPGAGPRGGFFGYLKRRAWRILPPYYAALALSLALIVLFPVLRSSGREDWARDFTLGRGSIAAHLLLVHNVRGAWCHKIDPPMWSVAVEWQIYFLFPALAVIWRRLGYVPLIAAAFACGYAPLLLGNFGQSCPWYLGLFALGMAAAAVTESDDPRVRTWRERLGGLPVALTVIAGLILVACLDSPSHERLLDPVIGAIVGLVLVDCAGRSRNGRERPAALRFLESGGPVALGTFSYSLYLVHFPLLCLALSVLGPLFPNPGLQFGSMLLIATPACVAAAYVFHLAFERGFMTRHPRPGIQAAQVVPAGA